MWLRFEYPMTMLCTTFRRPTCCNLSEHQYCLMMYTIPRSFKPVLRISSTFYFNSLNSRFDVTRCVPNRVSLIGLSLFIFGFDLRLRFNTFNRPDFICLFLTLLFQVQPWDPQRRSPPSRRQIWFPDASIPSSQPLRQPHQAQRK